MAECFANLECRLADARLVWRYNFFIFEVMKADERLQSAGSRHVRQCIG